MTSHIRIRVHDQLGQAVQFEPDGDWWLALPSRRRPESQVTDDFVHRPGWRELDVTDPKDAS